MKILVLMLGGALLGMLAASWIVPPALSWYTTPGGLPHGAEIQAVVQISEVIRYTTSRLIRGQLIGAGIGAVLGLVLGLFWQFRSRRPTITTPASTSHPSPA